GWSSTPTLRAAESPAKSPRNRALGRIGGMKYVPANPYRWPYDGNLAPGNTALIVIDMQTDFCGKGGYIDLLGYDISLTRASLGPIQKVPGRMRERGFHILHTREGHRPDLADLPANKR